MRRVTCRRPGLDLRLPAGVTSSGSILEPDGIAGLWGWWNADNLVLDDDAVVEATDLSASGRDLLNAAGTAAVNPTGINSKPTISFTAAGTEHLATASFAGETQPNTYYAIVKPSGTGVRYFMDGIVSTSAQRHRMYVQLTTNRIGAASNSVLEEPTTSRNGVVSVVCFVANTTSSALYINDFVTALVSGTAGTASPTGVTVGSQHDGTSPFSGEWMELFVYAGAHDAAARASLAAYLTARSGVSVVV